MSRSRNPLEKALPSNLKRMGYPYRIGRGVNVRYAESNGLEANTSPLLSLTQPRHTWCRA